MACSLFIEVKLHEDILDIEWWKLQLNCVEIRRWMITYPHPQLTHLPLDKTAAILAEDIFQCIFLNENDRIPI